MSEWFSVCVVFWVLWAIDGLRILSHRVFTVAGVGRRSARTSHSRVSLPSPLPTAWRFSVADVPLALSPAGICNQHVGTAGRPAERPAVARAWRWAEIAEVGVAKGWIFVNGRAFCPDTGHVKAPELLELARTSPAERERWIERRVRDWFRPARLRRQAALLLARTRFAAGINSVTFAGFAVVTAYVVADVPALLPSEWSDRIAALLPWMLLGLFALHLCAWTAAWRAKRRLPVAGGDRRGSALASALLLPPQALRLRMLVGEGVFSPQHPLAAAVAFGGSREREAQAFQVISDLLWPIGNQNRTPLAQEVAAWFSSKVERNVRSLLERSGIAIEPLLAPPAADSPASCLYCPRCRSQFREIRPVCPNGVELRPLR